MPQSKEGMGRQYSFIAICWSVIQTRLLMRYWISFLWNIRILLMRAVVGQVRITRLLCLCLLRSPPSLFVTGYWTKIYSASWNWFMGTIEAPQRMIWCTLLKFFSNSLLWWKKVGSTCVLSVRSLTCSDATGENWLHNTNTPSGQRWSCTFHQWHSLAHPFLTQFRTRSSLMWIKVLDKQSGSS